MGTNRARRPSDGGEAMRREVKASVESDPWKPYDPDRFRAMARVIAMALAGGNYEQARLALESQIEELEEERERPPLFATPLATIGIETRIVNALENRLGVMTVGDLLARPLEEVLGVPGLGEKSMILVMQRMVAHVISAATDER